MVISRNANYNLDLGEVKEFLDIDPSDSTFDLRVSLLIKVACEYASNYLQEDIFQTVTTIEEENYLIQQSILEYRLPATNITISGITLSTGYPTSSTSTTLTPSQYGVEKFSNYTNIRFPSSVTYNKLVVTYSSGMPSIPQSIKHAIILMIRYLFDVDQSQVVSTTVSKTNTFDLLLAPYKNLYF